GKIAAIAEARVLPDRVEVAEARARRVPVDRHGRNDVAGANRSAGVGVPHPGLLGIEGRLRQDRGRTDRLPVRPRGPLVRGADECTVVHERLPARVLETEDLVEEVDEGTIRQYDDLVPERLVVASGVVDGARRFPVLASVGRP